jgi:hypothetical protein
LINYTDGYGKSKTYCGKKILNKVTYFCYGTVRAYCILDNPTIRLNESITEAIRGL